MIKGILFDLDGSLLPVSQESFTENYFALLGEWAAKKGFDPKAFLDALWKATKYMYKNDGACSNAEVFWREFPRLLGRELPGLEQELEGFYARDFGRLEGILGPLPDRSPLLRRLMQRGFRLALASNPLFPRIAMLQRLRWLGLSPEDFDLIPDYSLCCFAKPSPGYYRELAAALSLSPAECLMVGNSLSEDALPMQSLGGQAFVLTELLEGDATGLESFPHGSWQQLEDWLAELAQP